MAATPICNNFDLTQRQRGWHANFAQALVQTPRWKRHEGADFVFYDPHPGFTTGRAEMPVLDMWCSTFRRGMHIVAERSQRNVCQHYWAMAPKVLVVPYVPATSDVTKPLKVPLEP